MNQLICHKTIISGRIDSIDANTELLKQAQKKGVYSKLIQQIITPDGPIDAGCNNYDFVTCIGSFIPNHVPTSSVRQMVLLVKSGGFFVYSVRTGTVHEAFRQELENEMKKLVEEGLICKHSEINDFKCALIAKARHPAMALCFYKRI